METSPSKHIGSGCDQNVSVLKGGRGEKNRQIDKKRKVHN